MFPATHWSDLYLQPDVFVSSRRRDGGTERSGGDGGEEIREGN